MADERIARVQFQNVNSVLSQFHDAGVLNLDKSIREMMAPGKALSELQPGGDVATSVVAWDGYGLVIKSSSMPHDLVNVAQQLRQITGGGE
jgi:hypothetical protein